ncbi:MAG TPA: ATP-binding protein [Candidatus Acidoferrales bacterium]|jgi:two-component system sensor histidine kinase CpxA|nr:ATP-binding protein [Candidatus Acidoferrales bacterium]
MRSLFFKIFLWFWLGFVVLSAALVTSAALIRSRSADDERWRQKYDLTLDLRSQHEADLLERSGVGAAAKYIGSLEQRDPMQNYMLDQDGHEVLGRSVPEKVLKLVPRVQQAEPTKPLYFNQERIMAERVTGASQHPYAFFMTFPPRPFLPHSMIQFLFEDVGTEGMVRWLVVLATGAIFCLWLARHITGPIGKLRLAAREIASEHLDARVDKSVTDRRDELAELGRDFDRMAERIDLLVSSQRRLLADVSHELRSPLTRLNLALGLARQRANPEAFEHLDRIERETDRLNKLIGQLLSLARIESGVDLQQKKVFDLGLLVQEVASDGDYEARGRNCSVKFDPSFECSVNGAPEMLRGAVENVVRNAVRHTADGTTVDVAIECRHNNGHGSRAAIQVRDHGTGVPENELADLFVPFYRVVDGIRKDPDGAGLGLAIAERAFRLHGGSVTAANAADGGLVVTLELPILGSDHQSPND